MKRLYSIACDPAFQLICFLTASLVFSWPFVAGILQAGGARAFLTLMGVAFSFILLLFMISRSCKLEISGGE